MSAMIAPHEARILTINGGSSSIKFSVFDFAASTEGK